MPRPFLTSVGFGMPIWGVWGHRYFYTKRRWKFRYWVFLGFRVVLTSYKVSREGAQCLR